MPTPPPNLPPPDPFTLCYGAIWSALIASADWQAAVAFGQTGKLAPPAAVPVGNFVRFDQGQNQPGRMGVGTKQPADFPQVVLLQSRLAIIPAANSLALEVEQSYPLVVTAPDLNVAAFNYLKWQTIRALVAAGESLGLPKLVRTWNVTSATDSPRGSEDVLAAIGTDKKWVTVLAVNVEINVPLAAVAAGTIPTT